MPLAPPSSPELLDVIASPFVSELDAEMHFRQLDRELELARQNPQFFPPWLIGVVTLRPRHQLEMEHSVRRRGGQTVMETRIVSNPGRPPYGVASMGAVVDSTSDPEVVVIGEDEPPETQRETPFALRKRPR